MSGLSAEHLMKRYGSRQVLQDVSVKVEPGKVVGLLGPNGAGKTTCFYLIVGLIHADQGRILLDGRDLTRLPMHARARAGLSYLPQEPSVFRKLTARENILAILETRRDLKRAEREERGERLLEDWASPMWPTRSPSASRVASAAGWRSPAPWRLNPG
jgi:ABC-type (unclassified) transport system, ATPase component